MFSIETVLQEKLKSWQEFVNESATLQIPSQK